MSTAIDILNHSPIVLNNNVYHLAFAIWESFSPPIVIVFVCLRPNLLFASCNIFKLAIIRNYSRTSIRISTEQDMPGRSPSSGEVISTSVRYRRVLGLDHQLV